MWRGQWVASGRSCLFVIVHICITPERDANFSCRLLKDQVLYYIIWSTLLPKWSGSPSVEVHHGKRELGLVVAHVCPLSRSCRQHR